jgi:hypothetical protein
MAEKIFDPQVNVLGAIKGSSLSVLSAVACVLPEAANFIGYSDSESYTALRWKHLARTTKSIGGQWVEYEGIEESGLAPKNFGDAAVIEVNREKLDKLQDHTEGRQAVVYKLGSTTMMGSSSDRKILGLEHEDDEFYKFAMRRGRGPLVVSVGTENDVPGGSVFSAAYNTYTSLNIGIQKGPTMPIFQIPRTIPLF